MCTSKIIAEIAALRATALDDLMATSDAELHEEALEDGEDLNGIAAQVKVAMRKTAAGLLRQRMSQAKTGIQPAAAARPVHAIRPSIELIKQIVEGLFQSDHNLGLAFRDGKRQSDSDWQSLYDDLVTMGAINPNDDGL